MSTEKQKNDQQRPATTEYFKKSKEPTPNNKQDKKQNADYNRIESLAGLLVRNT